MGRISLSEFRRKLTYYGSSGNGELPILVYSKRTGREVFKVEAVKDYGVHGMGIELCKLHGGEIVGERYSCGCKVG